VTFVSDRLAGLQTRAFHITCVPPGSETFDIRTTLSVASIKCNICCAVEKGQKLSPFDPLKSYGWIAGYTYGARGPNGVEHVCIELKGIPNFIIGRHYTQPTNHAHILCRDVATKLHSRLMLKVCTLFAHLVTCLSAQALERA
jgi:hypothetical protein